LTNLIACGYDWGGSIAIKMAIKYPKMFKKIMVLCPSYSEENDELKKLNVPTLVHWCAEDRMHNWKKFKEVVKRISKCTTNVFNINPYYDGASASTYEARSRNLTVPSYKFLTG